MQQVGIAVVGCGRIGETHIDGIKQIPDRAYLAAVVDTVEERARATAERHGVPYYTTVEAALRDPRIHAVVIALPHSQHLPVAEQVARAGRHVLVEKVMARNLTEARRMVQVCDENGVVLMSAQSRRYFYALQEARRRRAEIGQTLHMLYTFACYFDKYIAPPWWRSVRETGGLAIPMLGSHAVDYCLWYMDDQVPVTVYTEASSFNPDLEGPDEATVLIRFANGALATNVLSINARQPRHECYIIGNLGTMYFSHAGDHVGLIGTASTDLYINGQLVMSGEQYPHNFAVQMKEFVDSIVEGREPISSGKDVLLQLQVLEAAKASALRRQPVDISGFNEDVYV